MDALFHVTSQGDNRLVTPIDRYSALRQGAAVIADMALVEYEQAIVESGLTVEHRYVGRVSSNYFDLIGVRPVSGRLFSPATVAMDEGTNVVVSFGLWRDLLGSPSSLSGIAITVKGVSYNVIGVTPPRHRRCGLVESLARDAFR